MRYAHCMCSFTLTFIMLPCGHQCSENRVKEALLQRSWHLIHIVCVLLLLFLSVYARVLQNTWKTKMCKCVCFGTETNESHASNELKVHGKNR